MLHINNISTVLQEAATACSGPVDMSLMNALKRVDIMASLYLGSRVPTLVDSNKKPDMPEFFTNTSEARRTVDDWTSFLYYFLRTTADRVKYSLLEPLSAELLAKSEDLKRAFGTLETMIHAMSSDFASEYGSDSLELTSLAIRARLNKLIAVGCLFSNDAVFDSYVDEFQQLLDMCIKINSSTNGDQISSILLDETLLHPLTQIVSMCRDCHIRHQALRELDRLAKGRQSWHVDVAYKMSARLVELEESWSDRDTHTPKQMNGPRVVSYGFDSLQNLLSRNIDVQYTSLDDNGRWTTHDEVIAW